MTRGRAAGRALALGATAIGLLLFTLVLRSVGAAAVAAGVRQTGAGFLLILFVAGLRQLLRAAAWAGCTEQRARLPLWSAFGGVTVGEALGNLTPLGVLASEPAKVLWVRDDVGVVEASAALAVETLIYSAFVVVMLVAGGIALVSSDGVPAHVRQPIVAVLSGCAAVCAGVSVVVAKRSGGVRSIIGWLERRAARRPPLKPVVQAMERARTLGAALTWRRRRALMLVSALELAFHAAAIAEVYVALLLLDGAHATLFSALVLESVNRLVTIVFKFVPFRLGVDEVASGLVASLLGGANATGVMVAVVRKGRAVCWSLAGLILLGWRTSAGYARMRLAWRR